VCIQWHELKITQPLDGVEFTAEWAEGAARHSSSTWHVADIVSELD
jgi:hypothetical protein